MLFSAVGIGPHSGLNATKSNYAGPGTSIGLMRSGLPRRVTSLAAKIGHQSPLWASTHLSGQSHLLEVS